MDMAVANTGEIRYVPYMTASGVLHGGLIVLLALSAYFHWQGNRWAGPGGGNQGTRVTLVGNSGFPMPNTPSLIGKGATAYALGDHATMADAEIAEKVFSAVGIVYRVRESALDAVTGLSGSGPAYVFTFVEALADGGVMMGLPREVALELAVQTVFGSALMIRETGKHPAELREMVASPGGTTMAAIEILEARGLRHTIMSAVRAASERARELGRD